MVLSIALPHVVDYPPPFLYALTDHPHLVRRAVWAIEAGMGGEVEWQTSFGERQATVILLAAVAARGRDLGRRKTKHRNRNRTDPKAGPVR